MQIDCKVSTMLASKGTIGILTCVIICLGVIVSSPSAASDRSYRSCTAVDTKAEVSYPDNLVYSLSKDTNKKWCKFTLSYPPDNEARSYLLPTNGLKKGELDANEFVGGLVVPRFQLALPRDKKDVFEELRERLMDNANAVGQCFTRSLEDEQFRSNLTNELTCYYEPRLKSLFLDAELDSIIVSVEFNV